MSKKSEETAEDLLRKHGVFVRVSLGTMTQMLDQSVPVIGQARRIHGAWMNAGIRDGWEYGLVRDPTRRRDPRMRPFDELTEGDQREFYDIASSMRNVSQMN